MAARRRARAASSGPALEEAVVRFLDENPTRSFKLKELQRALRVPHSAYRRFRQQVVDLARAGRISVLPRRRYASSRSAVALEGEVEGIGQRATHVRLGDGSRLALIAQSVDQVVPGDRLRLRRVRDGGETLAAVERVLRAAPREVFGRLMRAGSRWVLIPEKPVPGLRGGVFLAAKTRLDDDAEDQLARGSLGSFDPASERPELAEVEVLGPEDHPEAAIQLRLARSGWPRAFSAEALDEAAQSERVEVERLDLRDEFVVTIDPVDAKDHDDAVSVEALEDGGFRLGVHIADVALRVRPGTRLDEEARARATSVYPPGRVLPMLPEVLSSGDCSLHHGVERDAITVVMDYDGQGRRRRVALGLTTIRSRASLSYETAEAMLDHDDVDVEAQRLADGVSRRALAEAVRRMSTLAGQLRERRRELGSLFVQRPEREFEFDATGRVTEVRLRPNLRAHWIIEEFMLEANRAVAEILQRAELPLLWRIHEPPDEAKVDALSEILKQFDITWVPPEPVSGHDYAELFARIEGRPEAPLLHLLALRSLMKARYAAAWERHFGLCFERYTHFTSPIRRYPDLHNQRWLHRLIGAAGEKGWIEDALGTASAMAVARLAGRSRRAELEELADHCSEQERQATRIERDCADICAAAVLKAREGQRIEGFVVSVLRSGVFVELGDSGLDGFVPFEQIGREWFHYDDRRQTLTGERTGRRIHLGQRVSVLLEYVDIAVGRTWVADLRPVEGGRRRAGNQPQARKRRTRNG